MSSPRIALVYNYSEPFGDKRTGGLITSAIHLKQYGFDPVFVGPKSVSHIPGVKYAASIVDVCDGYDFLIFSSPGSIDDWIKGYYQRNMKFITKPFAVQSHRETDDKLFKEQIKDWFEHKMFRFFMPITKDLWEKMPDVPTYPYLAHQSSITNKTAGMRREWLVVSSSRLTSSKRIHELARQAKGLKFQGEPLAVEVHGTESSYFYTKDLREIDPTLYKGAYLHDDRNKFLTRALFHWNCFAFKKKQRISPRLEIASIEAAEFGCRLIVHKDSTPPEYWHAVIGINSIDPGLNLGEQLDLQIGDPVAFREVFNALNAGKEQRLLARIKKEL
jgi:hypothetical protein